MHKIIKKVIFLTVSVLIPMILLSQLKTEDLFMQKEIRSAYGKKTRSFTGEPGINYFINKTDYKIRAYFNPETRIIKGTEIIDYTNNSPDTLIKIVFNLYQDLYKKGNARDWDIGFSDITDGVNIKEIRLNGKNIDLNSKNITNRQSILKINLPDKIIPGSTAKIEIKWELIIPLKTSIRQGTYEKDNFFIAYWFPKVAVYDDIVGWNTYGHTGSQEFYNDFGNYEVDITVPGNYQIWSTGLLKNMTELYSDKFIRKIKDSRKTDSVIHIITEQDRKVGNIMKKADFHTWKFKSEQTPDFAFAVSKTYLWDASSIKSGNRRVYVNAVYKPSSENFKKVVRITQNTLKFFTEEIPGIPYPYPQITDFNGGGGMEFPGMTNCGETGSLTSTIYLTAHETGHSYFPFYTGLNEQKYAWLDEGLITFFPQFIVEKYSEDDDFILFKRNIAAYNKSAGTYIDVPMMISSNNVGRNAYRFHAYNRSSTAFYLLYNYLGREKFTKGLNLFIKRWSGKHPMPFDFFFTFNEIADEDLAWFWEPWFFNLGYADLSIDKINISEKETEVVIKNKTRFPVPVHLKAVYNDGKIKQFNKKADIWKNEEDIFKISVPSKDLKELILDTKTTPDAFPADNIKKL